MTNEEIESRYLPNVLGAENDTVHIYSALIAMAVWNEYPNSTNVPATPGDRAGPQMKKWDLPEGWLRMMVVKYSLTLRTPASPSTSDDEISESVAALLKPTVMKSSTSTSTSSRSWSDMVSDDEQEESDESWSSDDC